MKKQQKNKGKNSEKNPKKRNSKQTLKTSIRRFIRQIFRLTEQKFQISIAKSENICNFAARILFFCNENKLYLFPLQE